jgi:hypothetical protein
MFEGRKGRMAAVVHEGKGGDGDRDGGGEGCVCVGGVGVD